MIDGAPGPDSSDAAFHCSPWPKAQGVDPAGSAGTFDAALLLEWPLPWPRDVSEIPALASAAAHSGVRVTTVVRRPDDLSDGKTRVVHHRRVGTNRLEGVDHSVPFTGVPDLLAEFPVDPQADSSVWATAVGLAPPEVLVCTHGRRDRCCGRWGTLLHAELAARLSDVRVWRCNQHRRTPFAPTAMTFPEGRAWAYVDSELLDRVVARTGEVSALAEHDRGTTSLDLWAQVVERALFQRFGWVWLDHEVTEVESDLAGDHRSATVALAWRAPPPLTPRTITYRL